MIDSCNKCQALVACRKHIVNEMPGSLGTDILIVGQNPNAFEDDKGMPFVGKYGQLLKMMCDEAGLGTSTLGRVLAVRCLAPGGRKPAQGEVENCRPILMESIREMQPKVIIAMGDTALQSLISTPDPLEYTRLLWEWDNEYMQEVMAYEDEYVEWKALTPKKRPNWHKPYKPRPFNKPKKPAVKQVRLSDVAGQVLTQPDTGIPVVPTYSPMYLVHGHIAQAQTIVVSHLQRAKAIAEGTFKQGELGDYRIIRTLEELKILKGYLLSGDTIWFDLETTGTDWQKDEILCLSFSTKEGEGFVVPMLWNGKMHGEGDGSLELWPGWEGCVPTVVDILKDIFESPKPKGFQNGIFDMRFLERKHSDKYITAITAFGFDIQGDLKDTELLSHLVNENIPHNADTLLSLFTSMPGYSRDVSPYKKRGMATAPTAMMYKYAAADADALPRLWNALRPIAEAEGTAWVYDNVSSKMIRVCREMEKNGLPIDINHFNALCAFYDDQIQAQEKKLWALTPHRPEGWKYTDSRTLRTVLFKELQVPASGRKTEGGRGCAACDEGVCFDHDQTGKDALEDILDGLASSDPRREVMDTIVYLKKLVKLRSTYLHGGRGGFKRYIKPDMRIHSSHKLSRTETGRLADENPNTKNIPNYLHIHPEGAVCSDTDCRAFFDDTFGLNTSSAFHDMVRAPDGRAIMNADWSQLEIWVLAYRIAEYLGDDTLLKVMESGQDIHLWMARAMYPDHGPDLSDREWKSTYPALRRRAKMANFGIGYGLSAQGFMLREHCTEQEAIDAIDRYKSIVPIEDYFRLIREDLSNRGYVSTIFGRRRHIDYLPILRLLKEQKEAEATVRECINFPIQSGGSDLHSVASHATWRSEVLRKRGVRIIGSVHDSLTMEVDWPDDDYIQQTAWMIRELWQETAWNLMRPDGNPLHWKVPVEIEWGKTWGTADFMLDAKGNYRNLRGSDG